MCVPSSPTHRIFLGYGARVSYLKKCQAIRKQQTMVRGLLWRKAFLAAKRHITVVQALQRRISARKLAKAMKDYKSAVAIQALARKVPVRVQYVHFLVALVVVQTGYRCRVCRLRYQQTVLEMRQERDKDFQLEKLKERLRQMDEESQMAVQIASQSALAETERKIQEKLREQEDIMRAKDIELKALEQRKR